MTWELQEVNLLLLLAVLLCPTLVVTPASDPDLQVILWASHQLDLRELMDTHHGLHREVPL